MKNLTPFDDLIIVADQLHNLHEICLEHINDMLCGEENPLENQRLVEHIINVNLATIEATYRLYDIVQCMSNDTNVVLGGAPSASVADDIENVCVCENAHKHGDE